MLDADRYQHWLDRMGFSAPTRTLLSTIRQADPTRSVSGRAGNLRGRYPSQKMGRTMQFESHKVELWAMYTMEHDPLVLEYYEQPNRIKLQYQGPSGRNVTNWHPPDFLVLRQDGAVWEEWKPESTLVRLVADHPSRYQRSPSGGYQCPPGEAYAQALGLDYHVRSSAELPPLAIQNLMFLEDYWITPLAVPAVVADPLIAAVSASPGIALATVLQLTPEVRPNTIYALIAAERLYIDWSAAALGDQTNVRLYADAGSMPRVTPHLRSLSPLLQTALYWDGQPYLLIAQTEQGVQLQAEFGLPLDLPQDLFTQLLHSGAIRILTAADPAPLRREVRQIVAHTSPQAGTIAQERLLAVQSFLLDRPQGYAHVAGRTLRRWVTAFHAAEARYGSGFVGLIPQRSAQGNHTPRADETARSLLDQTIRDRYADPRQRTGKAVYLTYQSVCATHGILPVSQRHFYRRLQEIATPEVEAQRRGTRAVYAETAPYWTLEATTPRHGDRPFAIAHLDHTVLDIEVVSSQTGRNLGRPWATFLMDSYSRRFLAVYLTFDPPSYRSCMMALRICVRQHHRLGCSTYHTVAFTFSAVNLQATATLDGNPLATFGYDNANRQTSIAYPNGVTQTITYDGAGHETNVTAKHGSTVLTNFTYSYIKPSTTTKTGIRYSVTDINSNVTKYSYDALNRLTDASVYNSGATLTAEYGYGFDGAGNRTTATLPSGSSSYNYNTGNELTSRLSGSTTTTYSYDGDGNLTGNSTGFGAVYNALNQTTSITPPGQSAQSYNYTGPNQAQLFNNNGNQMVYDKTGLYGNGTDAYFHDTRGNLLAAAIGAGTYYYLEDGLGSIVGLTDVSGNVAQSYQYDPYGNVTSSTGSVTANPWQFAGGFYDSTTGLYKFGIRYYDPTLGRWTQQDPLGGSLFDPSTGNRYAYTNDDPTNLTDPTGKDAACTLNYAGAALGDAFAFPGVAGFIGAGVSGGSFLTAAGVATGDLVTALGFATLGFGIAVGAIAIGVAALAIPVALAAHSCGVF